MELIELPDLSVGSPSEIGLSCFSQVEMSDVFEAPRRVGAGGKLVGQCLVMDEFVRAR
jgi:hypothetical protein